MSIHLCLAACLIRSNQRFVPCSVNLASGQSLFGVGKTQVDSADIGSYELPLLVALCLFSSITSWPWNIIAATVSILIAIPLFYDRYRRWRRSRQLRDPFEIHFLIPTATDHKVDYYRQDNDIHLPDELVLPSNSEKDVMIRMVPRLDLVLNGLQFGCIGEVESKPEPLYHFDPYVKEGIRRKTTPKTDKHHYKDWKNYYHIEFEGKVCHKDDKVITGLKVRTKVKGTFCFWVCFATLEQTTEKRTLTIKVT